MILGIIFCVIGVLFRKFLSKKKLFLQKFSLFCLPPDFFFFFNLLIFDSFILEHDETYGSMFSLLHMDSQFSQHCLLKRLSFPQNMFLDLLSRIRLLNVHLLFYSFDSYVSFCASVWDCDASSFVFVSQSFFCYSESLLVPYQLHVYFL